MWNNSMIENDVELVNFYKVVGSLTGINIDVVLFKLENISTWNLIMVSV